MQSLRVLLVFVALSQVECAPPSIWAAHRFSPPELWPFKQQPSAPSPHAFFTHFPETSHSPSQIALPVETVVVEPIIAAGNPVPTNVLPKESALPSEIFVQEIVEVKSAPQPQESIVFGDKMVTPLLAVPVETVTNVPVETSTVTTAAPLSFRDTEHFQAYEQFLSTWLQQASLTLNRPELLNMFKPTKQTIAIPEVSPTKTSVEKSVSKSVEKVVEQVIVSESVEPQVTPVEVASPEISKILKNISGPLKKTPATLLSKSSTDVPLVAVKSVLMPELVPSLDAEVPSESLDITVLASNPAIESQIAFELVPENPPVQEQTISEVDFVVEPNFLQPEPIPSLEVVVPSEQLDITFIASDPALETLNIEVVAAPEQIAYKLITESPIVHEQTIFEVDFVAEPSFLQPKPVPSPEVVVPSNPLEITFIASDPALDSQNIEVVATPEQIAFEIIPERSMVHEQSISEVDLVAEPSFLQPVVVSHPAIDPQLFESSYSKLSVSPTGTVSVAPNPQAITSSVQPSLIETVPEPAPSSVIESFSPQGLTYTLKYYPKHRSSFFYSHALGG